MTKDSFEDLYSVYNTTGAMTVEEIRKYLGMAPGGSDLITLSECMKEPRLTGWLKDRIERLRPEYMQELLRQIDNKIAELEDSPSRNERTEDVIYHLTTWYGLVYSAYDNKMNPPKVVWTWGDERI